MSETTPLNEWPLKSLLMLKTILNKQMEENLLPESWHGWYYITMNAIDQAIKDSKEKLTELPF